MKNLAEKIADVRQLLKSTGLPRGQIQETVNTIRREYPITLLARKAYDDGCPEHEGPVWFDKASWKTEFWKKQWRLWQAYREGENARTQFQDKESNPYHENPLKFKMEKLELEASWNLGFRGEDF